MSEDRIKLLEDAMIGINTRFDALEVRHKRSLHVMYEISKFKRKRRAEAQIKKLLKYKIIPILERIDVEKLDAWYGDNDTLKKAVKHMRKALEHLEEWY